VPDLLDHLRAAFSPTSSVRYDQRFDEVREAPLLILDDLGHRAAHRGPRKNCFRSLNHRYNAHLPTVITSNQSLEEIDVRLRSRMVDPGLATICTILAPDFRRSGVDQGQSDLSSLPVMGEMTFARFDLARTSWPAEQRANLKDALGLCQAYAQQPRAGCVDRPLWLRQDPPGRGHRQYRVAAGQSALFVVVPDLLDHLRATFSPASQCALTSASKKCAPHRC